MKKLFILVAVTIVVFGGSYLLADGDDKHENDKYRVSTKIQEKNTPQKDLYVSECASCHMAYQAEFLPKRSWNKMMNTLEDHFGVDATLEKEDEKILVEYLKVNAADSKPVSKQYRKIAKSIKANDTPLRISDAPYFKKEHKEVPLKYIEQKEVKSIANCTACHQKADLGDYKERNIFIPNYGKWDD